MKRMIALLVALCMLALVPAFAEEMDAQQAFMMNLQQHLAQMGEGQMLSVSAGPQSEGGEYPFNMFVQSENGLNEITLNLDGANFQVQFDQTCAWIYADSQVYKIPYEEVMKVVEKVMTKTQGGMPDLNVLSNMMNDALVTIVAPYITQTTEEDGTQVIKFEATLEQLAGSACDYVDLVLANEEYTNFLSSILGGMAMMQMGMSGDPIADLQAQWPQMREGLMSEIPEGEVSVTVTSAPQADGSVVVNEDIYCNVGGEVVRGVAQACGTETKMTLTEDIYVPSQSDEVPMMHVEFDFDLQGGTFDFLMTQAGGGTMTASGTFTDNSLNGRLKVMSDYRTEFVAVLNAAKTDDGLSVSLNGQQGYEPFSLSLNASASSFAFDLIGPDNLVNVTATLGADGQPQYIYASFGDMYDTQYVMYKNGVVTFFDGYQTNKMYITYESESVAVLNVDVYSSYRPEVQHNEIRLEIVDGADGWQIVCTAVDSYGDEQQIAVVSCDPATGIVPLDGQETFTFSADMLDQLPMFASGMVGAVEEAEEAVEGNLA